MRGLRYAWAMAVLSLCGIMLPPAQAAVTKTGSTYDNGMGSFYAGYSANGTGTLTIDSSSVFSRGYSYLGYATGSTGTATVTGAESIWTNSGYLSVGHSGAGALRVEAGAQVSSTWGYLGYNSGSTGTAIVTGSGSKWFYSEVLRVGYNGAGTLRVEAGAEVDDSFGSLGENSGSTGTAVVTGAGSKWVNSMELAVGYHGSGTLNVENGAQVSNTIGYLGEYSGSTGEAIITGPGSKWTNSDRLHVGYNGAGTLRVEAGAQVSNTVGYLGYYSGSTGSAIVGGAGSKWTNSGDLYVGSDGSGTLTVSDGGAVSAKVLYASLSDLYGNGTVAVQSGAVLDADLVFDATHGAMQTVAFGSGGTLQLRVNGLGNLGVGYKHTGSLRIAEGRSVNSNIGFLGYNSGSTGTAIITGAGSKWSNYGLNVGYIGSGTLTVSDGGQVTATGLSINSQSTLRLHVSVDRMLLLGDASTTGSISNAGKLSLLADAFLPAGIYRPIGEYAGRALTWSGSGTALAVGGVWDSTANTFTVLPPTPADAGTPAQVSSGQRLLITDPATGHRAGLSFGALTSPAPLTSLPLPQTEQAALLPLLAPDESILSAWSFTAQLSGSEALLSFEVGLGAEDLHLWRLSQTGWSEYKPEMLTYDKSGLVSFTLDPASLNSGGYALSATVPEPATLALLILAPATLLPRRRSIPSPS